MGSISKGHSTINLFLSLRDLSSISQLFVTCQLHKKVLHLRVHSHVQSEANKTESLRRCPRLTLRQNGVFLKQITNNFRLPFSATTNALFCTTTDLFSEISPPEFSTQREKVTERYFPPSHCGYPGQSPSQSTWYL